MISRKQKIELKDDTDFSIKVSVKINERLIEQDIEESFSIPRADKLTLPVVQDILSENTVLHARWGVLYNEAVYEYDILKTRYEVWLSKKSQEYRKELEGIKTKGRVTDKMVEDMIKDDPDYEKMNDDLAKAKKNMKHVFVIANGFGEKGERIVNIASLLKWEGDSLVGRRHVEKQYQHIERDRDFDKQPIGDPKVNDGWPT
jgi:hypothetical protein